MDNFEPILAELSASIRSLRPYQPGKPIDEVKRELGISGEIVKLASNENPLGPSPLAMDALAKRLPELALYPDGACHDLRDAVAARWDVAGDQLIFGNGSDEIIHLIGLAMLTPGDEVVVGDPTFVLYESAATLAGATTVKVPLTRPAFEHDVDAMADAFTEKTRLVFVANPHNPTGSLINGGAIDRLLSRMPARAVLVLDEAYGEFVDNDHDFTGALTYIKSGAPVLGLRTFSKMFGLAGLRVGYGIGDSALIAALNQARSPFNVNLAAQVAATAAVTDDKFVESTRKANSDGLEQLTSAFDNWGLSHIPTRANFVMVDVKQPCREVFDALLRQGIIVRTGDIFGLPTSLRVTIGTEEQNNKFLAGLNAVLETYGSAKGTN